MSCSRWSYQNVSDAKPSTCSGRFQLSDDQLDGDSSSTAIITWSAISDLQHAQVARARE
ncbi:MAG: hypothetical protein M1834_006857 [Cirrosporium novae-zelandiae]|nr:MAG: hypothetical protein M1834_006857 [Cirrosporium novae-zelandiae]